MSWFMQASWGASSSLTPPVVHRAPIIIPADKIREATRFPISSYRLFATDAQGVARAIPFQIDEFNQYGDFVLDQGSDVTKHEGNGLYDAKDELLFMGDDVGPVRRPQKWENRAPNLVYEITQKLDNQSTGAVYLGIYFGAPPPLSKRNYVVFDPRQGEVRTSRYVYRFDQKNYLIVRGVEMNDRSQPTKLIPIVDTSTFYLKADLKYFLTFELSHNDIQSYLEAFKVGPIRTVARVAFFYRFLKLNFELGMFTEVSLFSNSVILPAIMYNPLDASKSLNDGSGFYYGFALHDSPDQFKVETNMPSYESLSKQSVLPFFRNQTKVEDHYWLSIFDPQRMMYMEITPSNEMKAKQNIPYFYRENISGTAMRSSRNNDRATPLGKSPVNLAIYFDLTRFSVGEHRLAFQLFFDNFYDAKILESYKNLSRWEVNFVRL